MDDIKKQITDLYWSQYNDDSRNPMSGEIDRLHREVLQLQGVVRAHEGMYERAAEVHEGMYERAAEEIDRLRGWLERTYRMAVGHDPNWEVFDGWEEAISACEEARRG